MTTTATDSAGVTIRQATRADLLEVHQIETQAFPQPWPYHAFENFLSRPGFLVAFDGMVLGYVVADANSTQGRRVGHVKDLAVHPRRRREGIGTSLLDRALGVLRTNGINRVKLEVRVSNDRARTLYRHFGFEYSHTVSEYYDDGEDALILIADALER